MLNYMASIRPEAEPYGMCRIVPPPSWVPLCPALENIQSFLRECSKWTHFKTGNPREMKTETRGENKEGTQRCLQQGRWQFDINGHLKRFL